VKDEEFRERIVGYLPHLRAVARSLTGRKEWADDLVHDTILRALSAEAQFQPGTNLKAWLLTILRNHYINNVRRRRFEVEPMGDIPDSALPVAATQDTTIEINEVGRALQTLAVEHREILVLVSAAGMSYEEAAEVCGVAVGTIKSRLNRARNELKKALDAGAAHANPPISG
jgi:RNA polymerase sigma-70 factor (ECF subfamily)